MRKLLKLVGLVMLGLSFATGVASAQSNITNTGTGSTNTITHSNNTNINISNSNNVSCNINSSQNSSSGNSTANGNTNVGNVSTGNASNDANLGCDINSSNGAAPINPGSPTTPTGGQGAGGVVAGAVTTAKVAALPSTGELSLLKGLGAIAASVITLGIASQAGLIAYRRFALNA